MTPDPLYLEELAAALYEAANSHYWVQAGEATKAHWLNVARSAVAKLREIKARGQQQQALVKEESAGD